MLTNYLSWICVAFLCLPSTALANSEFECSINNFSGFSLQKASPQIEDLIDRIVTIGKIKQKYTVCKIPNIKNAGAVIHWDTAKKIIIYDPVFLDRWARLSGDYHWGMITILAHEIGHHVKNHTARKKHKLSMQEIRDNELDADQFAGYVLANLGASLDNSVALMSKMDKYINDTNHTHPSGEKRLNAIKAGWQDACKLIGTACNDLSMKFTNDPVQQSPRHTASKYETAGYSETLAFSSRLKGKNITRDYCKAYANLSVEQASKAKQAKCGFNIDRSKQNNQWSLYWKPQYDWCMQSSAHASSKEIMFRETKLKNCVAPLKASRFNHEKTNCIMNDALHKAAAKGNVRFVQTCLQLGVNPNVTERNNWTPLHSAARNGHLNIVKLLVQKKSNINARDSSNRTPLDHAIIGKYSAIISYLKNNGGVIR